MIRALITSKGELLALLLNPYNELRDLGRNLDYCIETHIHGDILLEQDIDSFFVDGSYRNTIIGEQAETLCMKYGFDLHWIPKRQIDLDSSALGLLWFAVAFADLGAACGGFALDCFPPSVL